MAIFIFFINILLKVIQKRKQFSIGTHIMRFTFICLWLPRNKPELEVGSVNLVDSVHGLGEPMGQVGFGAIICCKE